ncbi:MAG: molybdopterin cofactor-binding domain-containing protein [Candidatus Cloacimonadota bacterium]|nr:molybdopterin cofactor-binding domain-containing protein [Candidatus Cloacimonadota bacterium]
MSRVVGQKVKRIDGYEKVTGKAIYGDDIKLPGLLYAAVRYSDIPAGKIIKLKTQKAKNIRGVKAIALHQDVPGSAKVGPIRQDYLPIVKDEVFFTGDVIAVIAAETKEIACQAAEAINIEYKEFEPVTDITEAIKPSSRLVHPEYKSNIMVHYPLVKGDIEAGFAQSDHIIERTYRTGYQEHAYIEPESVTAVPDPSIGGFKIFGSIQNPYTTRKVVAMFMGLKLNQINIMQSTLGGSFGGKDDVVNNMACRAALLAYKAERPVKLTYNRENSMRESYKRHPYLMKYKVGFNKNGKLKSMKIDILAESGAYSSQSFFVTWRSVVQATGPYEIENVKTDIKGVYTNKPYTAAFRGFGSPQIIFAQESLIDEIAEICGISPLDIRKINGYKQGSITASGQRLDQHTVSLNQVMQAAAQKANFAEKYQKLKTANLKNERYKLGIGLSCSFRGCSLGAEGTDTSSAIISVQADGSVILITGVTENGQGLRTTLSQIAAEILGIDINEITFLQPQTSTITDGGPTVASRGTIVGGNATIKAAEEIKKRIFSVIKKDLKTQNISQTIWKDNKVYNKNNTNLSVEFSKAAEKAYFAGINLSAYGWFKAPEVSWHEENGQGNAYFTYVYGCQVVEVKLDTYSGKIFIEKITAAHDVGKVINRLGAEGQVYGGTTQGMGYGVIEDFDVQKGIVKSDNLDQYLIPTIKDIKNIEAVFVENPDKYGPLGAKSLGEPTLELTAAAINNALFMASGKRSYEIPLTLEQVKLDKNLKKPVRQSEASHSKTKLHARLNNITTHTPKNMSEALKLIKNQKYRPLAGGTDLVVQARKSNDKLKLLNIYELPELKEIKISDKEITLGAGITFSNILKNSELQNNFPLLMDACSLIGSTQIRNRATIGGNIVNAAPCADSVPPLIAYGAKLKLTSFTNSRKIELADFIQGSYKTKIQSDELLTEIIIPKLPNTNYFHNYFQLGRRGAVNITRMSISVLILLTRNKKIDDCRIVDGSLFKKPQRITAVEDTLLGQKLSPETIELIESPLSQKIEEEIGGRWSAEYKKPVFINICKDALYEILEKTRQK